MLYSVTKYCDRLENKSDFVIEDRDDERQRQDPATILIRDTYFLWFLVARSRSRTAYSVSSERRSKASKCRKKLLPFVGIPGVLYYHVQGPRTFTQHSCIRDPIVSKVPRFQGGHADAGYLHTTWLLLTHRSQLTLPTQASEKIASLLLSPPSCCSLKSTI